MVILSLSQPVNNALHFSLHYLSYELFAHHVQPQGLESSHVEIVVVILSAAKDLSARLVDPSLRSG